MKKLLLILVAASLSACSTDYYTYQGGAPMIGQGGAAKNVNGIEIWLTGAPPRKFQIIGYIEDTRPGGPLAMMQRYPALAASAKQHGGDGILIQRTGYSGLKEANRSWSFAYSCFRLSFHMSPKLPLSEMSLEERLSFLQAFADFFRILPKIQNS